MEVEVRAAARRDITDILRIERQAAQAFRDIGYPQLADGAATPINMFETGLDQGFMWVTINEQDTPTGFALASLIGGLFYLEDISVDPQLQRQGLGDALLSRVIEHARFLYCPAVALSTLSTAPWSEPFYRKHGFLRADMNKLPEPIREQFQAETQLGLPAEDRIVMVKRL